MPSSWTVIGLCGVTNSGKTSLSNAVAEKFKGTVQICQDHYFHPVESESHILVPEVNHFNWDIISALDMDRMVADVRSILDRSPTDKESGILVLDGFLILAHEELSSLCSIKVYIDLDFEEVKRRRLTRNYDPPDPPGYFEKVVWPESRKAKDVMFLKHRDILILSGKDSIEDNLQKIITQLEKVNGKKPSKT